jgi:broad specificity phosphatase PhoE
MIICYHRHGQTIYTVRRSGYGDNEYKATLTPEGRKEVHKLGGFLQKVHNQMPFDLYLSSPLARAVQTASIVQTYLGDLDLEVDMALIEGIKESQEQIWQRVNGLVDRLLKGKQQNILISTHGFLCQCLTARFEGYDYRKIDGRNLPPTASFGWAEFRDGKVIESYTSYDVHLKAPQTKPELEPELGQKSFSGAFSA